jgi:hypothetical protein
MIKEKDDMITKFEELKEKINLSDIIINVNNENKKLIEKIKRELSIITYKKSTKPKSIRITEINGYFHKNDFKNDKLLYRTLLNIYLSNNDRIKAKLSVYREENENNILIKINNKLIYNIDNKNFNEEILIDKLINKYKEHLLKNYKKLR